MLVRLRLDDLSVLQVSESRWISGEVGEGGRSRGLVAHC